MSKVRERKARSPIFFRRAQYVLDTHVLYVQDLNGVVMSREERFSETKAHDHVKEN